MSFCWGALFHQLLARIFFLQGTNKSRETIRPMWSLCRVSFESIWVIPNRKLPIVLTNFCPEIYRKFECPRMPLAFASTLGGTLTMIGSAANLLASDCARALEPAVELGFFALSLGWNPWEDNKINVLSPWRPLVKDFLSPWSVACSDLVPKNGEVSYGWVHIFLNPFDCKNSRDSNQVKQLPCDRYLIFLMIFAHLDSTDVFCHFFCLQLSDTFDSWWWGIFFTNGKFQGTHVLEANLYFYPQKFRTF